MVQTAALKMHAMPALRAKENKTDRKEWEKWLIMRQSNSSNIVQSRIWWVKGLSFTDELALKCMLRKEERKKLKEEMIQHLLIESHLPLEHIIYVTPQGAHAFLIWPWTFHDLWLSWHRSAASCCSCFMTWLSISEGQEHMYIYIAWFCFLNDSITWGALLPTRCYVSHFLSWGLWFFSIFLFQPAVQNKIVDHVFFTLHVFTISLQ